MSNTKFKLSIPPWNFSIVTPAAQDLAAAPDGKQRLRHPLSCLRNITFQLQLGAHKVIYQYIWLTTSKYLEGTHNYKFYLGKIV